MDATRHNTPQRRYPTFFTAPWQALNKKQRVTLGGIVAALCTLVVVGLRKSIPWDLEHK